MLLSHATDRRGDAHTTHDTWSAYCVGATRGDRHNTILLYQVDRRARLRLGTRAQSSWAHFASTNNHRDQDRRCHRCPASTVRRGNFGEGGAQHFPSTKGVVLVGDGAGRGGDAIDRVRAPHTHTWLARQMLTKNPPKHTCDFRLFIGQLVGAVDGCERRHKLTTQHTHTHTHTRAALPRRQNLRWSRRTTAPGGAATRNPCPAAPPARRTGGRT